MAVAVLARRSSVQGNGLAALELEATLSEVPSFDADVTEHPVEEGFNIADGIRNKPITLQLEGVVSNTPVLGGKQAQLNGGYQKGSPGAADDAFSLLQKIRDAQDVVTVATRLKTYESMALTALKVTRDQKTGDALTFSLSFKQVRVVSSKFVSYPSEPRGSKKSPGGDKAKTDAGEKKGKSAAARVYDFFGGKD